MPKIATHEEIELTSLQTFEVHVMCMWCFSPLFSELFVQSLG